MVDSNFLFYRYLTMQVFVKEGNAAVCLQLTSVNCNKKQRQKYFGNTDAIGKSLRWMNIMNLSW